MPTNGVKRPALLDRIDRTREKIEAEAPLRQDAEKAAWAELNEQTLRREVEREMAAENGGAGATPAEAHRKRVQAISLPPSFYRTPELKSIVHAAQAAAAHPDGALGVILTHVSGALHPSVTVATGHGSRKSLNFYAGVVSRPGGGKDRSMAAAKMLLPFPIDEEGTPIRWDLGSGEGLIDTYLSDSPDEKGQSEQEHERVYLTESEAENLFTLMDRSGSTLSTTMLKAWDGGDLGNGNVKSGGRRRTIQSMRYRFSAALGFQPTKISDLLKRRDIGFPHRFVLFNAVPETRRGAGGAVVPMTDRMDWLLGLRNAVVTLPDEILERLEDISEEQLFSTSDPNSENIDSHIYVLLVKLISLLCLFHGRLVASPADLEMAEALMENSAKVRENAHTMAAKDVEDGAYETGKVHALVDQVRQDAKDARNGESQLLARAIMRIITKVGRDGLCAERDAKRAVDSRTMKRLRAAGLADSAADVLAEAVRRGVVVMDESGVKLPAPRGVA
ncbi:DUF3987 domain-containing protein [Streptomyces sp. NPDC000927]|uniref:DUF3987 domain-containing protein n=1 Tax=Streptomyces sp. NPDC000927 TaxID=3154371 RepID=UPI003320EB72